MVYSVSGSQNQVCFFWPFSTCQVRGPGAPHALHSRLAAAGRARGFHASSRAQGTRRCRRPYSHIVIWEVLPTLQPSFHPSGPKPRQTEQAILPTALDMPGDAALAARRIDALIVGVLTIGPGTRLGRQQERECVMSDMYAILVTLRIISLCVVSPSPKARSQCMTCDGEGLGQRPQSGFIRT